MENIETNHIDLETPEIPWKPQLLGKPTNEGLIQLQQYLENDYNLCQTWQCHPQRNYAWM